MEKPGLWGTVGSEPSVRQAAVAMAQLEHPVAAAMAQLEHPVAAGSVPQAAAVATAMAQLEHPVAAGSLP